MTLPAFPSLDFPPLTVAELASVLGVYPQAIRDQLRHCPATGKRTVSGNPAGTWHLAALPAALRSRLVRAASARGCGAGCAGIAEMFKCHFKAWQPPVPLSEISDDCLAEADKLKRALLPSLRRQFIFSQTDSEREGVAEYAKVFGLKISTRHFRNLIARTMARDGGQENYERVELYLPAKPGRKQKAAEPPLTFPFLAQAINDGVTGDELWQRVFRTFSEMTRAGTPRNRAARRLRNFLFERVPSLAASRDALRKNFDRKLKRFQAAEPFDKRKENGPEDGELTTQIKELGWFIPAARFFYLLTNRGRGTGSTPEAVLQTISLPNLPTGWPGALKRRLLKKLDLKEIPSCPVNLREIILQRQHEYKPLVPASIARQIVVNKSIVQFYRSPREWSLENQSAPGSQRRYTNTSGERVIMQPGDWFGGDDATPGIAVCVPCNEIITPCSEKFGVLLGRFQWLAYHDCRTDKILGWDYVVRPRGSYRAEDILTGMGAVVLTNGIPRKGFQFEGGTWNSKLVCQAIDLLGCEHWRTYSPHQKAIESVFNRVWTRLALQFPHADMGRFRNENESNCKLYEACKKGHKDPRRYFPTLESVVKVFEEETGRHNAKPINSRQYGQWIPDDFFSRSVAEKPLRIFSRDMDWILSPFTVERTVRGMMVSCQVPMFENISVPFEFGADWLPHYNGRKVRLHFNPRQPRCLAKIVLLENAGTHKAGDVLGDAQLIGETGANIRYFLNWGDDNQRAGYLTRQRVANYVRRETRGIGAAGRVEYSKSEGRNGLDKVAIIERAGVAAMPVEDDTARSQKRFAQNMGATDPTEQSEASRRQRRAELDQLEKQTAHLFP
jgi:hypothetical protein